MTVSTLIELAEMFATHRNLKLSTVSTYAANDGKFFGKLKDGSGCTLKTAGRIYEWFDANWPADLEWPKKTPRPNKRAAA